jgi:hypothetical protein
MLALLYNGSTKTLSHSYDAGALVSVDATAHPPYDDVGPFWLGKTPLAQSRWFNGELAHIMVWKNRLLSVDELTELRAGKFYPFN